MKGKVNTNHKNRLILSNYTPQISKGQEINQILIISSINKENTTSFNQRSSLKKNTCILSRSIWNNLTDSEPKFNFKLLKRSRSEYNNIKMEKMNLQSKRHQLPQKKIKISESILFTKLQHNARIYLKELKNLLKKEQKFDTDSRQSCQKYSLVALFSLLGINMDQGFKNSDLIKIKDHALKVYQANNEYSQQLKQNKLSINSNTVNYSYSSEEYLSEAKKHKTKIQELLQILQQLNQEIKQRKEQLMSSSQQRSYNISINQHIASIQRISFDQIPYKITQNKESFKDQIIEEEVTSDNYQRKQQYGQIIELNQQYKKAEIQLIDYISFFQEDKLSNQKQVYSNFQPYIKCNLQRISKLINCGHFQVSNTNDMMTAFILQAVQKFNKKNEELICIIQSKNEYICNLINKIQKWMQKIIGKQSMLISLRSQFLVETKRIVQKIEDIDELELCTSCINAHRCLFDEIVDLYKRIGFNYKMTNSLY